MELKYSLVSLKYSDVNFDEKSFHLLLENITLADIETIKKYHDLYSHNRNECYKSIDEPLSNGRYLTHDECRDYYANMDIIIPCITKEQFEKQLK